ncbi:MAG TPA: 2-amino-4-hydroxy-6-hydroxymethyldihydropteridine diphosphokinase [Opitutaceae bacterium]|nr:2-amino-4-hydroxy-6-hydroxymethyldihydropteridine diphosphokinase [Opitutaceae bacterium]
MTTALIGLGANLGDRATQIASAVDAIARLEQTRLLAMSALHETDPVGYLEQPRFLNAVAAFATELSPEKLLEHLLAIERAHGRERSFPNAPRTLDLDLLFYGQETMATPTLTVPHPRWHERLFVLVPLREVLEHPVLAPAPEWNELRHQVKTILGQRESESPSVDTAS